MAKKQAKTATKKAKAPATKKDIKQDDATSAIFGLTPPQAGNEPDGLNKQDGSGDNNIQETETDGTQENSTPPVETEAEKVIPTETKEVGTGMTAEDKIMGKAPEAKKDPKNTLDHANDLFEVSNLEQKGGHPCTFTVQEVFDIIGGASEHQHFKQKLREGVTEIEKHPYKITKIVKG